MSHRFFVETPIQSPRVVLTDAEAHHVMRVMRAQIGSQVVLFDGTGAEFSASVVRLGRHGVELSVHQRTVVDRELERELILGVALPKGDRQRWLVEKAVELGVQRLVPLETDRGIARPTSRTMNKLRRAVVESSKQSGRNRLMEIAEPLAAEKYFQVPSPASVRWLAHPPDSWQNQEHVSPTLPFHRQFDAVYVAVGPEGGFSASEIEAASDAGWQLISLGPRILRIETAAIALASVVAFGNGNVASS